MKNLTLWGFFSLILGFALLSTPGHAKDYSIPEIEVEVQINPDGTLRLTQHYTYVFDGDFSWANVELKKSGFSAIRDIQVSEGGQHFTNRNSEDPGTFLVEESDEAFNIKWFYEAEDEERVFTVTYTLENAIVIGPEWSEFFWNYVAAGREKSTKEIYISIDLPNSVEAQNLHSWVRNPQSKITRNSAENGFVFQGTDIDNDEAVIKRVVFPTSVFDQSQVSVTDTDFTLEQAEQEEADYLQEQLRKAEEEAYNFNLGVELAVIIAGLSILCFVFLYRKYGTRHDISLSRRNSLMIPGKQKPALIGWLLMHRNTTGGHLTATLLDLARRNYLVVKESEEKDEEESSWLQEDSKDSEFEVSMTDKKPSAELPEWELSLLDFLNEQVKDGKEKLHKIFKGDSTEFSKWFASWKKMIKETGMAQGWIDPESYKGMYWNLGVQSVLVVAAILAAIFTHEVVLFSAAASLIGILLSMVIIRRTPRGEEVFQTWKAYREALKNAKEYSIPKNHLGQHFIYGTTFGLNQKNIEELFEQNPEAVTAIYWIVFLPGTQNSPSAIASSFSTLAATGSVSASGGSVSGGGASAGAAGGGTSAGAG